MAKQLDYNTTTDNIEKLCGYFDCSVCDLAEFIRHESDKEI
ncbi:hypothetical protein [Thiomicrorhabdus aquaedulcis]